MSLDGAIQHIQALALSSTDTTITAAPDYPVDDATKLPLSISYMKGGTGQADDAGTSRLLVNLGCDVHFSRDNIKLAYKQINLFVPEFIKRLNGDPTLNGNVQTIVFPVPWQVVPAQFNTIVTQMVTFDITVKFREASI